MFKLGNFHLILTIKLKDDCQPFTVKWRERSRAKVKRVKDKGTRVKGRCIAENFFVRFERVAIKNQELVKYSVRSWRKGVKVLHTLRAKIAEGRKEPKDFDGLE